MASANTWLIVLTVFLGIFLVVMIVYNAVILTQRVSPSQCPVAAGNFGVQPNKTAQILSQCGADASDVCTFTGITSLAAAIDQCNQMATICNVFLYSYPNATMSIVDPNSAVISGTFDLYTRQYPTIIT